MIRMPTALLTLTSLLATTAHATTREDFAGVQDELFAPEDESEAEAEGEVEIGSAEVICSISVDEDDNFVLDLSGTHAIDGGPAAYDVEIDLELMSCTTTYVEPSDDVLATGDAPVEVYVDESRYDGLGYDEVEGDAVVEPNAVRVDDEPIGLLTTLEEQPLVLTEVPNNVVVYTDSDEALLRYFDWVLVFDLRTYQFSEIFSGEVERVYWDTDGDALMVMDVDGIPTLFEESANGDVVLDEDDGLSMLLDAADGSFYVTNNDTLLLNAGSVAAATIEIIQSGRTLNTSRIPVHHTLATTSLNPAPSQRWLRRDRIQVTLQTVDPPQVHAADLGFPNLLGRLAETEVGLDWGSHANGTVEYIQSDYWFSAGPNELLTEWFINSARQGEVWYDVPHTQVCTYGQAQYLNTNFILNLGALVRVWHHVEVCGHNGFATWNIQHVAGGGSSSQLLSKRVIVQ